MQPGLMKCLALSAIDLGLPVPTSQIERFQELTHLKRALVSLEINCVMDVGANRGQFAQELRRMGYKGLIASFEPVRGEFELLSKRFDRDSAWRGFQMALGSESTVVEMNIIPNLTVMSSVLKPTQQWPRIDTESVQMRRLDEMFEAACEGVNRPRVLLKMDTQGYDLNVFRGAHNCLEPIRALQSEVSIIPIYEAMPHYLEALRTYEEAGFRLFNLSPVSRVAKGELQELNCLMIR
jgi:FkbM family methyltransferase